MEQVVKFIKTPKIREKLAEKETIRIMETLGLLKCKVPRLIKFKKEG